MKYITGTDRSQINLFPVSLDQSIEHDNEIRLIDAFSNSLPKKNMVLKLILWRMAVRVITLQYCLNLIYLRIHKNIWFVRQAWKKNASV